MQPGLIGDSKCAGAVYVTGAPSVLLPGVTAPQSGLQGMYSGGEQGKGSMQLAMPHTTLHVTPPLPEGPLTVAVNGCVPVKGTAVELGDTEINVVGVPLPDRAITGLVAALVDRFKLADFAPGLVGVNVTLTVHDSPAATVETHVFVCANIAESIPAREIPLTISGAFPVFDNVTTWAAVVVPTSCWPNASDERSTLAAGACNPP